MADKTYHHGDLRAALVRAARAILERDGLSALTLRACAREAGVSHAAPLHHFHSLAGLHAAVAASGFEDFVGFLDGHSKAAKSPRARLIAMGQAYVQFAAMHPALYRLMFGVEASQLKSPALEMAMSKAWNQLETAVAATAGAAGAAGKAVLVWSVVHGHAMLQAARYVPPIVDLEVQLGHSLNMLATGIGATDA